MAKIIVVGGGICGLLTGLLLAQDDHEVTVLERDPTPPPEPGQAWTDWDRKSVRQFHMGHFFLPRFRSELERELPAIAQAIADVGALRMNPIETIPESITGGWQDGDERYEALTGRRPVIEAVIAAGAAAAPGLTIRRGVTATGLIAEPDSTPVHLAGVETEAGERIDADLVVDTTGRNSALPRLLAAVGAGTPAEEADDSGFVYYGRAYRSDDGSIPFAFGGGLQSYGSISTLTLAADNGTWQLAFVASGQDKAMRKVRDEETFNRVWGSYPLVAHWLDGEPISELEMMGNLADRIRHFVVDGVPVATGLAAIGDSWACTNPSVGRGASIGLLHAVALRDQLRETSLEDRVGWSLSWAERTAATVEPYYRETVHGDRHRLAHIEAAIEGREYESDDPVHRFTTALEAAAPTDPQALRAWLDTFMLQRLVEEVMADGDFVERILALDVDLGEAPGLNRAELEALLAGQPA